jgi:hypothetical protein
LRMLVAQLAVPAACVVAVVVAAVLLWALPAARRAALLRSCCGCAHGSVWSSGGSGSCGQCGDTTLHKSCGGHVCASSSSAGATGTDAGTHGGGKQSSVVPMLDADSGSEEDVVIAGTQIPTYAASNFAGLWGAAGPPDTTTGRRGGRVAVPAHPYALRMPRTVAELMSGAEQRGAGADSNGMQTEAGKRGGACAGVGVARQASDGTASDGSGAETAAASAAPPVTPAPVSSQCQHAVSAWGVPAGTTLQPARGRRRVSDTRTPSPAGGGGGGVVVAGPGQPVALGDGAVGVGRSVRGSTAPQAGWVGGVPGGVQVPAQAVQPPSVSVDLSRVSPGDGLGGMRPFHNLLNKDIAIHAPVPRRNTRRTSTAVLTAAGAAGLQPAPTGDPTSDVTGDAAGDAVDGTAGAATAPVHSTGRRQGPGHGHRRSRGHGHGHSAGTGASAGDGAALATARHVAAGDGAASPTSGKPLGRLGRPRHLHAHGSGHGVRSRGRASAPEAPSSPDPHAGTTATAAQAPARSSSTAKQRRASSASAARPRRRSSLLHAHSSRHRTATPVKSCLRTAATPADDAGSWAGAQSAPTHHSSSVDPVRASPAGRSALSGGGRASGGTPPIPATSSASASRRARVRFTRYVECVSCELQVERVEMKDRPRRSLTIFRGLSASPTVGASNTHNGIGGPSDGASPLPAGPLDHLPSPTWFEVAVSRP